MSKPFYITTTLPYVNAVPHIGHALEFVRADVIARHKRESGFDVFFNIIHVATNCAVDTVRRNQDTSLDVEGFTESFLP